MKPHVYVDADACPVKPEVFKVAERHALQVTLVAGSFMRIPTDPRIRLEVVTQGFDAADDWIAEHIQRHDVLVTADIPLAGRALAKGARQQGVTIVENVSVTGVTKKRGGVTGVVTDQGTIEAEFEVDSNKVGQRWTVTLTDNGVQVFTGARTTTAPSGSFSARARIANRAGRDNVVARATNAATGVPVAAASRITKPNVSVRDGNTNTSLAP